MSTPRTAIYYPHTGVKTTELLKSGLLLWDRVEYIAPYRPSEPDIPWIGEEDDLLVREAMELLLVAHVPTDEEKASAHATIAHLANSEFADRLHEA
jgi:hypothetical protein